MLAKYALDKVQAKMMYVSLQIPDAHPWTHTRPNPTQLWSATVHWVTSIFYI
jgi:hypothetical protein